MKRRGFILALSGAAVSSVSWPLTLRAQQPKTVTIGILNFENPEPFRAMLRDGLRDLGYTEGGNLRLEFRSAEGNRDRLPGLAAELVGLKVDVLVAYPTPAIVSSMQATSEIPIIMLAAGDPARKLAADLALKYRIPAIAPTAAFAALGGLAGFSGSPKEMARRTAAIIDKILKGSKPADLPVEQPTTFELVINLKTAKALGITVPPALLARADEVIE
jgi:ABC-type uncharacterized transport system substrate-binding protein